MNIRRINPDKPTERVPVRDTSGTHQPAVRSARKKRVRAGRIDYEVGYTITPAGRAVLQAMREARNAANL